MSGSTRIVVDPANGVPPWRQVRDQLVHLVRIGELPIGGRLPPIRQLAGDLGLSAGTVARVYRELEAVGVLETARRKGTVVAAVPGPQTDITAALADAAADYVATARALGADQPRAVRAMLDAYAASEPDVVPQVAGGE